MPVNNPDRAFFWDETNKSWRAAQVGEAGEYVWNNTTKSWEFGTIGAEYKWNATAKAWEPGPGGQYVYNRSTKSWDKVTSPGYGGPFYWDTSTNSWVKNTDAAQVSDAFARWDFLTNQAWWDGAYVGALANTPNWTASPATHSGGLSTYALKSDGTLQAFASGTLRRTDKGVLIEGAGTNLFTQSADFSHADWVKTFSGVGLAPSVTANYAEAPDGTTTADRVQFSLNGGTTSSDISIVRQVNSTTGSMTPSFYVKSTDGATSYTMQIVAPDGSGTAITVTGSWQRVSAPGTSAGAVSYGIRLRGGATPTNAATADILIWGAQLEATAYASSYVPTVAASATRAADSLTVTGVSGLDYPLTLYAEFERAVDRGADENILYIDDGDGEERCRIVVSGGTANDPAIFATRSANVDQSAVSLGNTATATVYRAAGRIETNDIRGALNGSLSAQDTSATLPAASPTFIRFGQQVGGSVHSFGYLRRAAIYASAKTDEQLEAMTA